MKSKRYDEESLMDVFGTPRPTDSVIWKWKGEWRDTATRVRVTSFSAAIVLLRESGIDPVYYQIVSSDDEHEIYHHYIVFYKAEHAVYFKLHNGFT